MPLDQHDTASALASVLTLTGMTVIVVTPRTLSVTLTAASESAVRSLVHVVVIGGLGEVRAEDRTAAEAVGITLYAFEDVERVGEGKPVENVAPGE